jgi:hypothetical protein
VGGGALAALTPNFGAYEDWKYVRGWRISFAGVAGKISRFAKKN